jgi:hypothetical protein
MTNKLKYLLVVLLIIVVAAVIVWKVVNKPTTDYASKTPEESYTFAALMKKIETDTSKLRNMLIAVNGNITKITKDSNSVRLEIGSDTLMSSVTCDIDNRYIKDFASVSEGSAIDIKGIVSEVTVDPESSFGNTVALVYCTLNKK